MAAISSQISYKGKMILVSVESCKDGIHVSWLSQGWLMSVLCLSFLSNSYFFVCYFIHYDKSNIFTPVFKTASSSIATCYKTCKFKEYNDYLITFMFLLYFNISDLPELGVHYSCRIIGGTHSTCRCWMIYSLSKVT